MSVCVHDMQLIEDEAGSRWRCALCGFSVGARGPDDQALDYNAALVEFFTRPGAIVGFDGPLFDDGPLLPLRPGKRSRRRERGRRAGG